MTKKQLIEALAEFPDDAIIDVRVPDLNDDREVIDICGVITAGTTMWVTLELDD